MKKFFLLQSIIISLLTIGCATGGQKVLWSKSGPIDFSKGVRIDIKSSVTAPQTEIDFMKKDIEEKVAKVLNGNASMKDAYTVKVIITKYDEGSSCARFMLIGLGQMYLDGSVEVSKGEPPVIVRTGEFKKNYCVGGIMGGMAKMHDDMVVKVGEAIAEALKEVPK